MSLQAVLTGVSSKSYRLAPGIVESPGIRFAAERVTVGPYSGRCAKFGSSQHCNPRCYGLYSGSRCWHSGLQSTSIQAITADYDSSSGDELGSSSAHAMDLPTDLSGIGDLKYLGAYLQEALEKLKERGLPQISKEGFEEAYTKLKSVNGKSLFKDASQSVFVKQGARMWQTSEPWIKWPLAIFGAAYLLVLTSFGVNVAQDLTPLWILGPLFTGWMIRSVYLTIDFIHKGWVDSEPFRLAVMESTIHVYEDYKRGELFDKIGGLVESKERELRDGLAKKRSDMVLYVKSGQAATDVKALVLLWISQLIYWWTEKYDDFVEWVRPFWRAFVRLVKKIF